MEGAISLQKLLASNAITNENGVICLDTSIAQSTFSSFWRCCAGFHGMKGMKEEEGSVIKDSREEEEEKDQIEEISEKIDDQV